jgi:hypothetical protein
MGSTKIAEYLENYRDYIIAKTTLLEYIDESSSAGDLAVIYKHADNLLEELLASSNYVTEFTYQSLLGLKEIYENLESKISYIENSLSNFLNINTSEYSLNRINGFKNLLGSGIKYYNKLFKGYSLQQGSSNYKINPVTVKSSGNIRIETYILPKSTVAVGYDLTTNHTSTSFQEISFVNKRNEVLSKSELMSDVIPANTDKIVVLSVDHNDFVNFTKLTILENNYSRDAIIVQPAVTLPVGNLLRLHVEGSTPIGCYATAILDIQLVGDDGVVLAAGSANIGLLGDGLTLISGLESRDTKHGVIRNLNKDSITKLDTADNKYCLTQSYAEGALKYLGNNCIELPKIKAKYVKVTTTLILNSLSANKTPVIKSLIGYITDE